MYCNCYKREYKSHVNKITHQIKMLMCYVSPEVQLVLSSQNNIYVVPKHSDLNELFAETEKTRKAVKTRLPNGIFHYLQTRSKEEVERFCELIANGVKSQLGINREAREVYHQMIADYTAFADEISSVVRSMVSAVRGTIQSMRHKTHKIVAAQQLMEQYSFAAA